MHTDILDESQPRSTRSKAPRRIVARASVALLLTSIAPLGCKRGGAPEPAGSAAPPPTAPTAPSPSAAAPTAATRARQPAPRTLVATPVGPPGGAAIEPAPPVPFELRALRRSALFRPEAPTEPAREIGPGALFTLTAAAGTRVKWGDRTGVLAPVLASPGVPALAFAADLEPAGGVVTAKDAGQALMHGVEASRRPGCIERTERIQLPMAGGWAQRYLLYSTATDEACSGMMALAAGNLAREILAWTRRPGPIVEVQLHAPAGEPPIFEVREEARGAADRSGTRLVLLSGAKPELRELLAVDTAVIEKGPGGAPARRIEGSLEATPAERGLLLTVHTARIELAADGITVSGRKDMDETYRYLEGRVVAGGR